MENKEIAKKLQDRCWGFIANEVMDHTDNEKDFDEVFKEVLQLLINE